MYPSECSVVVYPWPSPVATVFALSRGGVPGTDLVPLLPNLLLSPSSVSLTRPTRSRRFRLLKRKLMTASVRLALSSLDCVVN